MEAGGRKGEDRRRCFAVGGELEQGWLTSNRDDVSKYTSRTDKGRRRESQLQPATYLFLFPSPDIERAGLQSVLIMCFYLAGH